MKERNRDHAWRTIVEFGRHRPTSRCRQGAGMSDVGRRKPVGFRPGQEVSCHGMTKVCSVWETASTRTTVARESVIGVPVNPVILQSGIPAFIRDSFIHLTQIFLKKAVLASY